MKYVSLDLETSGLDVSYCQILQIGMVITDTTDTTTPVEELPTLDLILEYDAIQGQPYALNMNAWLLNIIAEGKDQRLCSPKESIHRMEEFLLENGFKIGRDDKIRITVAGKNVGSFDMQFLNTLLRYQHNSSIHINYKTIELGSLLFDPLNHSHVPSLSECLVICGIDSELTHDAVQDARDVIRCIRSSNE